MESMLMWAVAALVLGIVVLILEIFIPSHGGLTVLAMALMATAVFLGFSHHWIAGTVILTTVLLGLPLLVAGAIWVFPYTPAGKIMMGQAPQLESPTSDPLHVYVGRIGRARSMMLPAGAVDIDGKIVDAITRGMPVEAGQFVKVVDSRANRIVVVPIEPAEAASAAAAAPRETIPAAGSTREASLMAQSLADLGIDQFEGPLNR